MSHCIDVKPASSPKADSGREGAAAGRRGREQEGRAAIAPAGRAPVAIEPLVRDPAAAALLRRMFAALVALAAFVSPAAYADVVIAPHGGDISGAVLSARLAQGDVTLTAASGDVVVNDAVSWSAHTLTLAAPNGSIKVNTVMTAAGTASLALQTADADGSGGVDMALSGNASTGNAFLGRVDFTGSAQSYSVNGIAYTLIHDIAELEAIRAVALLGAYALAADVDWSGAVDPTWLGDLNPQAHFDGLGHVVRNLSGPSLFFRSVGSLRNLGLQGGATSFSPLLADHGGVIANVYSTVTVTGAGTSGGLGGLIGSNLGLLRNAWASGSVSGSNSIGGLAGVAEGGTIQNAWASGNVTASGACAGGLVGYGYEAEVNIRNAYATGNVTGGDQVGGLVGCIYAANVQNVWASGSAAGTPAAGALVGSNIFGSVSNAYYVSDTPGPHPANGIGTPLTLANLIAGLPAGFDPAIWDNHNGRTTPYLKSMSGVIHVRDEGATPADARVYAPVTTLDQLQAINDELAGDFALFNDIDGGAGGGFVPIGGSGTPFTGRFDGLGHVVQSLTISFPGNYAGLFGNVGNSGVLRNVGVSGGSVSGGAYTGALAGLNSGSIRNAWASARVTSGAYSVGGLVGENRGSIGNAYATGEVSGFAEVGGLVGYNNGNTASIANAWASGSVTGTGSHVGGLAGFNRQGSIGNAYWDVFSTGQASAGENSGGSFDASAVTSDPAQTAAANHAFKQSAYASLGAFGDTVDSATWTMVDGSTRPFLQGEWQPAISNAHQLQLMRLAPDADYVLGSPTWRSAIDAGETGRFDGTAGRAGGMWAQAGFVPVGNGATPFTGSLDGHGHVIDGLAMNRADPGYIGLFGYAGSGSGLRRIALENVDITVSGESDTTGGYLGALVGFSAAVIADVSVSGHVRGVNKVGGLVGEQHGGSITGSHAAVDVVGLGGGTVSLGVGGLVGQLDQDATVSDAYATGDVGTGDKPYQSVGGLVGHAVGSISRSHASGNVVSANGTHVGGLAGVVALSPASRVVDSYASGNVQGTDGVGGLVGYSLGSIASSYASGGVSGGSRAGGLVGYNTGSIAGSFWNTDVMATGVGEGSADSAVGLSTLRWLSQGPIATGLWDTAAVWVAGYPYPVLKALPHVLVSAQGAHVTPGVSAVTVDSYAIADQDGAEASALVSGTPAWFADPELAVGETANIGGSGLTALDASYQLTCFGQGEVQGPPHAPANVSAQAGESQAFVTWDAPADDGGSPVVNYTVTAYDGATAAKTVDVAGHFTGQTVRGLTNGTAYTFKVTATNAAGTGVESAASAAVTPVDAETPNWQVETISVGDGPYGVALGPNGAWAWVANSNDASISVIDTASHGVTATIPIGGPLLRGQNVAFSPDGATAYVSSFGNDNVLVIDTVTHETLATIDVGDAPAGVALSPEGAVAYVANVNSNGVSVIDTATNTVTATIPVGSSPVGVAFSPDGASAYVTYLHGQSVSVIATATNSVIQTISAGYIPSEAAFSPDGAKAYVANFGDDSVSMIDTATHSVAATIPVGTFPYGVALSPGGDTALVTNHSGESVSVIDTATDSVTATIPVGYGPAKVAFGPDGVTAYVTNLEDDSVSVLRFAQFTVSFDEQGGSEVPDIVQNAGSTVTVPAAPTRTGYAFVEWNTAADGAGTAYAPGDTFTLTGDVTLFARWDILSHAVSASVSGGHGGISPASVMVEHGDTAVFTVTPETGYHAVQPFGGSCAQGTLTGDSYETGVIEAACEVIVSFAQTPAASVTALGGGGQSATVYETFMQPLTVRVADVSGNPLEGIEVTLASPASGASADFGAGRAAFVATTDADGEASVSVTANAIAGDYEVTASVAGVAQPATFALANEALIPELALTAEPPAAPLGQPVTLTLLVEGVNPTGTVDFVLEDGAVLCEGVVLVEGTATCEVPAWPAGVHTVTAGYSGDASHAPGDAAIVLGTPEPAADPAVATIPAASPWVLGMLALLLGWLGARRRGE